MYRYYIVFAVISFVPLQLSAAEQPTALELLDRYAETQDKLQSSFIIESRSKSIVNAFMMGGGHKANNKEINRFHELRFDSDRISMRRHLWYDDVSMTGLISKDRSSYISNLWDGKYWSSYARDPTTPKNDLGTVTFEKKGDDTFKKNMIPIGYTSSVLLGIFFGDYERVDSVLRQSENISVRDKIEKIGTSDCYVIEAVVKNRGRYTLWIDPQHGYNIAQATVKKAENAILYGKAPRKIKVKVLHSFKNVRFKKIDDIWLPEEADTVLDRRWVNGDFADIKAHHKLIEITLNPDHEALGSFLPTDVRNGAKVYLRELAPSITYTWQDGEVVDANGRKVMSFRKKMKKAKPKR